MLSKVQRYCLLALITALIRQHVAATHSEFYTLETNVASATENPLEVPASFERLDETWECPRQPERRFGGPPAGPTANETDEIMEKLYEMLEQRKYLAFIDATKKCIAGKPWGAFESQKIKTKLKPNIITVEDFDPSIKKVVTKIQTLVKPDKRNSVHLAVLEAYILLHAHLLKVSHIAVVLLREYLPGVEEERDKAIYPILKSILKSPAARSDSSWFTFYSENKGNMSVYTLEKLRQATTTYLEGRPNSKYSIQHKEGDDDMDSQDRQQFIKFLIKEERSTALQEYFYLKLAKKEVSVPTTKKPVQKKAPEILELDFPSKTLFLQGNEMFNEIFDGLMFVLGTYNISLNFNMFNRYFDAENENGICNYLRVNGENFDIIKNNVTRFLLTLTFMENQKDAQRIYELFVSNCKPFDDDQKSVVKAAIEYPKTSNLIPFLEDRSFFTDTRIYSQKHMDALLSKVNTESEDFIAAFQDVDAIKFLSLPFKPELYEFFDRILDYYGKVRKEKEKERGTSKFALKGKKTPPSISPADKWDDRLKEVFENLFKLEAYKEFHKLGIFVDFVEQALLKGSLGAFKGLCGAKRCIDIPLTIVRRFRDKVLIKLEEKLNTNDSARQAQIQTEIHNLQQEYIKKFKGMAEYIRTIYLVKFKDTSYGKPGLKDQEIVGVNFTLDYAKALKLTELPDLKPIRAGFWPWHSYKMAQDPTTSEEVLSHMLINALEEQRFYSINAIIKNPKLNFSFRNSDGFRFYVLFMLLQTQVDTGTLQPAARALKFEHLNVNVKDSSSLSTQYKSYVKLLASLETPKTKDLSSLSDHEKWKAIEKTDKQELFEPGAPPPEETPRYSPAESFLMFGCYKFRCPFQRQEIPSFELANYESQPEVSESPKLNPPMDGYVEELIMWLLNLCKQEIRFQKQLETVTKPAGGGLGLLGSRATKQTMHGLKLQPAFEAIIKALIMYMAFDPRDAKPILEYAHFILNKS